MLSIIGKSICIEFNVSWVFQYGGCCVLLLTQLSSSFACIFITSSRAFWRVFFSPSTLTKFCRKLHGRSSSPLQVLSGILSSLLLLVRSNWVRILVCGKTEAQAAAAWLPADGNCNLLSSSGLKSHAFCTQPASSRTRDDINVFWSTLIGAVLLSFFTVFIFRIATGTNKKQEHNNY